MPDLVDAAEAEPQAPSSTRLSTKQVQRLFGGDDTIPTLLFELDMGVYLDGNKVARIGLVDPGVHEHDRWLAAVYSAASRAAVSGEQRDGWYIHDGEDFCGRRLLHVTRDSVVNMLRFYKSILVQVRMRLLQINDSYVDGTEVISAGLLLNSFDVNDLVDVDYNTPLKDLHEMVHHTEAFIASHPDHVGIRRGNLLSLYGLADPYRDYHRALVATPEF